jgi:hypothetical protein
MADKRICVYLSQRDQGDSPPGTAAEVVYETLILPTMERFPDFAMNPRGYIHEPGSISAQLLDEILSADLVIADLTELSPSGYNQLGVRHSSFLPTVLMAHQDYVIAMAAREFQFLRYPQHSPSIAGNPKTIDQLAALVREALDTLPRSTGAPQMSVRKTPRERRYELAERIEATVEIIRLLRINSAGEAVNELEAIAKELKAVEDDKTSSALKEAADKVLNVLSRILDQLATVRGSRMAISGAIALVLGGARLARRYCNEYRAGVLGGQGGLLKSTEHVLGKAKALEC